MTTRSNQFLALYKIILPAFLFILTGCITAQDKDSEYVASHFNKHRIYDSYARRSKLFTVVYSPKDISQDYPILFTRTPYSVAPYGAGKYKSQLGPSKLFTRENYIYVYQDVRGRVYVGGNVHGYASVHCR